MSLGLVVQGTMRGYGVAPDPGGGAMISLWFRLLGSLASTAGDLCVCSTVGVLRGTSTSAS